MESKATGPYAERGTWVHPKVALNLAQWCSPAFAVKVTDWLYDWMMGKEQTQIMIRRNLPQDPQLQTCQCENGNNEQAASLGAKRLGNHTRNSETQAFLEELSLETGFPISKLFLVRKGGIKQEQGTWIHPDAAVNFGQWLSPKFALAVSRWVREWMSGKDQTPIMTDHNLPLGTRP